MSATVIREEHATAAICRAWDASPDGGEPPTMLGRVLLSLTLALEAEGLADGGKLTDKARTLIRRVDARSRKAGAS